MANSLKTSYARLIFQSSKTERFDFGNPKILSSRGPIGASEYSPAK